MALFFSKPTCFKYWFLIRFSTVFIAASFLVNSAHSALIFTGPWTQDPVWASTMPTFGCRAIACNGNFTEDHRFGAASVASGQITGVNLMPGVFRAAGVAIENSILTGSAISSNVNVWVQFSRTFNLTAPSIVTVNTILDGFLEVTDQNGPDFASVRYNAGIANPANTILSRINPAGSESFNSFIGKVTIPNLPQSVSILLQPGTYKVWGALNTFARKDADVGGGDTAESNFLSTFNVNVSAKAVPEPSTMVLIALGGIGASGRLLRQKRL